MSYSDTQAKAIHELCKVIDCEHKTAPYVKDSEFLVVRTSNVRDGRLVMADMKFTTKTGFDEWTQRAVPTHGDVLFTREAPAGESCLVPENKKICMGQRMVMLRPNKAKVDPFFLSIILATEKCKFDILRLSIGSTVSRINISDIKKLKVPAPPLPEQRQIAEILSTWDKAIVTTEKLIAASQQQKKALMQQLLTGKKRFAGFSEEWEEVRLLDIGKCITGLTYSPSDTVDDNGMLVLRSSNIQGGKLAFDDNVFVKSDLKVKSKTKDGDILICVRNGSKNLIGKSALIKGRASNEAHGAFMSLYRCQYPDYIFQLFQTNEYYRQVNRNLGATINSINNSDLHDFRFIIPTDKNEISMISKCLTSADQEIDALQSKLAYLKQEKKALMQQLLTGKRRVVLEAETSL
ncbi:restriction endonuclease subunit S [Marinomonas primoryensis]|uniref:Restriction endonuclease subunit S n=1 Tax=Marinomonas primoryensis TaxID=178399 RepID=A0ABV0KYL4_9GAMM